MTQTQTQDPVIVVILGDLHLTEPGLENHRVALWMVEKVNRLVRPEFVQSIGDNVQDATGDQFRLFDDLRARLTVPHYALVGDHDVHDEPRGTGFLSHLGPIYGATSFRGFRFLRLDTRQARPVGLGPAQVAWFLNEVDRETDAGERVVVFQHNYSYQIWEDYAGPLRPRTRAWRLRPA